MERAMLLCASSSAANMEEIKRDFARAEIAGADILEIRLDYLEPGAIDRLPDQEAWFRERAERLLFTYRPQDQGGHFTGETSARLQVLLWAASLQPRFIDFEFPYYERSDDMRQKVALLAAGGGSAQLDHVILSEHHTDAPPRDAAAKLAALSQTPAETVKLAWTTPDACGSIDALTLQQNTRRPATVFCMGEDGLCSRVLGRKFGAALTYAALGRGEHTAPGQPTIDELLERYRWRQIDAETAVYGLIGDPVGHSLSPVVHNAAFAAEDINAVYVPLRVTGDSAAFDAFVQRTFDQAELGFRGFSVTAPHKAHAFHLVEQHLEAMTRRLGAVNTLTLTAEGIQGDNTDYRAAMAWLQRGLDCGLADLAERRFAIIGAGGLGRTIAAALQLVGAAVTVHNRSAERAAVLAGEVGCAHASLQEVPQADAIIHCTPLGTWPAIYDTALSAEDIAPETVVFDAVYNPLQTRLLREAGDRGCRTVDGLQLFLEQAALQFTIWTGRLAPIDVMRAAALDALSADD